MSCWPSGTSTPLISLPDMPNEKQDASQHIGKQNAGDKRVGLELAKSSVVKQRKLRSPVWENFEKYKDENGKDRARCKVCGKDFDGSSKSGTTHLKNHFRSCLKKRNGDGGGVEPANLAGNLSNPIVIQEKSVMDQQLNHLDATRMIIKQGDVELINSTNVGYIIDVYKEGKEKLRNYFEKLSKLSRRLCLTVALECFMDGSGYMCLAVWFIDDEWKLKNKIIGYKHFEGIFIEEYLKNVLLEWGIENDISAMVIADDYGDLYRRMSCNEIREDWFSTQGSLLFNNKLLCDEAFLFSCDQHDNFLLRGIWDPLCASLSILFDKIRDNEKLQNAIDVEELSGKLWWGEGIGGILDAFKSVLGLKETFFDLENSHPHFQNLTKEEWDALGAICECLADTGVFPRQYCSNYNTANIHFLQFCRIYKCCEELRKCDFDDAYDERMERADNYWNNYNLVLAVASALDPRFKMDIVKNWYEDIFGDGWKAEFTKFRDYFNKIYYEYASGINKCTSVVEENNSSFSYEMLDPLGKLCKSSHELDHVQLLNPELRLYFKEVKFPSIKDFDVLEWWRAHARYFPTLARMARDFLSIQVSCRRLNLSEEEEYCILELGIEEAYACTKSWLCEEL